MLLMHNFSYYKQSCVGKMKGANPWIDSILADFGFHFSFNSRRSIAFVYDHSRSEDVKNRQHSHSFVSTSTFSQRALLSCATEAAN